MNFIFELVKLIKFSPKRLTLFDSLRREVVVSDEEASTPSSLCPTRWTVRHASINSILLNYKVLLTALEEIREGHDEYAAKGNGLLNQMESFYTFFGLKLSH